MGGCFIGYSRGQLSAESFTVFVSLSFMAFAYLGGITSVGGALVAGLSAPLGLTFVILDRNIELGQSYTLIAGVALILTAIFNPQGIAGRTAERFAALRHRGKTQDKSNESASPDVVRIASHPIKRDLSNAESVLQISGLTVKYGGLTAVGNVDLDVRKGEIVGLIGPNGAGKTTFIDAVTGFTHSEGVIQFDGRTLETQPLYALDTIDKGGYYTCAKDSVRLMFNHWFG